MSGALLEGGFADAVFGAQTVFRAIMDAFANPGTRHPLGHDLQSPATLDEGLAAVALTLCDHDTAIWLDPSLAEDEAVTAWLRFHTGAPLVTDPGEAMFALVSSASALPPLVRFGQGTHEYPDRSTTVALALPSLHGGTSLTLRGPGIRHVVDMAPQGLPPDFPAQWAENRLSFPRGVDLLLAADGEVIGLPRSTRMEP